MISEKDYKNLYRVVQAVFDASDKVTNVEGFKSNPKWVLKVTDQLALDADKAYMILAAIGKLP